MTYPVTDHNPTEYQSGECHSCFEGGCLQCTANECTECSEGHYLDSGTCFTCDEECILCTGAGNRHC